MPELVKAYLGAQHIADIMAVADRINAPHLELKEGDAILLAVTGIEEGATVADGLALGAYLPGVPLTGISLVPIEPTNEA